jgi:hypothetical protein
MPGEPHQNGVVERRNRKLMDMVRSVLSYSTLLIGLWMEALKTVTHILNRVASKLVLKYRMSYRQDVSPRLITFVYEIVLLRLRYLIKMLVN